MYVSNIVFKLNPLGVKMNININIVGGTRSERNLITTTQDGILEGLKYLAIGLGNVLGVKPTEIMLNTDSVSLYTVFLSLSDNKRLSEENTLSHLAAVGGEIAFLGAYGNTLTQFSIMPLYDKPKNALKNPTTYNIWWAQYRTIMSVIKDNAPPKFSMIRYTVKESVTLFQFTGKSEARKETKIVTFDY